MTSIKRKKIFFLITKGNWGGAQRYVFDLATALPPGAFDVAVVSGGDGKLSERLRTSSVRTISIESLGRDISPFSDLKSFLAMYRIFTSEKPDIIHLNSPKVSGLGSLAGRLAGVKKIVTTVHGFAFNEPRPFYQRTLIAFFSWITAVLCHKIIVISKKEYEQALRFPLVKSKLAVIPLGIKPPFFVSPERARELLEQFTNINLKDKMMIGTIAELHQNKGLGYLVEAVHGIARTHKNILSVIIGSGQERIALERLARERKQESVVRFTGHVDNASSFLRAFDIFVLPSLKEGLPYVLLESGAAELPVVATSVGGIPDIIEDGKTGLSVPPRDAKGLEDALKKLLEQKEMRKKLGRALKERIEETFSFECMFTKTRALYEEKSLSE